MQAEEIYLNFCSDSHRPPIKEIVEQFKSYRQQLVVRGVQKVDFYPIARTVPRLQKLLILHLDNTQAAPEHLIYCLQSSKFLRQLRFESFDFALAPQILDEVWAAMPRSVTDLQIVRCRAGDNLLKSLGSCVIELKLETLNLQGNQFKNLKPLLEGLRKAQSVKLDLSSCSLAQPQIQQLRQFVDIYPTAIQQLNTAGNKQVLDFEPQVIEMEPKKLEQPPQMSSQLKTKAVEPTKQRQQKDPTQNSSQFMTYNQLDFTAFDEFTQLLQNIKQQQRPFMQTDLDELQRITLECVIGCTAFAEMVEAISKNNEKLKDKLLRIRSQFDEEKKQMQQSSVEKPLLELRKAKLCVEELNDAVSNIVNNVEIQLVTRENQQLKRERQELDIKLKELQKQQKAVEEKLQTASGSSSMDEDHWLAQSREAASQRIQRLVKEVAARREILAGLVEEYQ